MRPSEAPLASAPPAIHDLPLSPPHRRHIDRNAADADPVVRRAPRKIRDSGARYHGFRRRAALIHAGPTHMHALDHRHRAAGPGERLRERVPALAGPDHDRVVVPLRGHPFASLPPLRQDPGGRPVPVTTAWAAVGEIPSGRVDRRPPGIARGRGGPSDRLASLDAPLREQGRERRDRISTPGTASPRGGREEGRAWYDTTSSWSGSANGQRHRVPARAPRAARARPRAVRHSPRPAVRRTARTASSASRTGSTRPTSRCCAARTSCGVRSSTSRPSGCCSSRAASTRARRTAPPSGGRSARARCITCYHETLDAAALHARFPGYRLPPEMVAVYQPDGGFVMSERSIVAYVNAAHDAGADVRAREPVLGWEPDGDGVRVRTATTRTRRPSSC